MSNKRILSLLLALVLTVSVAVPALAAGDPNIEGGGGGLGGGSAANYWNGDDGVRISVVTRDGGKVAVFDWANKNESDVQYHFGKWNKMDYRGGHSLTFFDAGSSPYHSLYYPSTPLPKIVSTNGSSNIASIRTYFTSEGVLQNVAADAGMSFDDLISGDYKLLLEPMAYFVYDGVKYAATATEAAYLNSLTKRGDTTDSQEYSRGRVWKWLGRLTHQNLPLAMYLVRSDLGFSPPTDADMKKHTDGYGRTLLDAELGIVRALGVGIVSFEEPPEEDDSAWDYEFHCDTDVIISFPIYSSGEINPDDNAYVTLSVGGTNYHKNFICPAGGVQTIWVRWHTPSTPCELTATATGAGSPVSLRIKVTLLEEVEPPDPTFYDTNPGFSLINAPDTGTCTRTTWGEWFARWIQEHGEHLGGYDDDGDAWYYTCTGYCKEHGWWEFYYVSYEARLTCSYELKPDARCQTDYTSARYGTVMPSGYGVEAKVTAQTTRGTGVGAYDVTPVQFVVATFPEFKYETYNRLLEKINGSTWNFKVSKYSAHNSRIHYTPLWYPDDTYYPVAIQVLDAWTPGGQLHWSSTEKLYIDRSCIDDWYIHVID